MTGDNPSPSADDDRRAATSDPIAGNPPRNAQYSKLSRPGTSKSVELKCIRDRTVHLVASGITKALVVQLVGGHSKVSLRS